MDSDSRPLGLRELLEDRVVALRLDHDGGEAEVLGRRADHRRPADVDVLDHLVLGDAAARRGRLERIEVHAHEVDELHVLLLGRLHVRRVVAQRQQPGVQPRVQRLHAAVHDLREAREVLDRADLEAGLLERGRRPAGGDQLDPELREPAREVDDARLVGDRQHGARDPHLARLRHAVPLIGAGPYVTAPPARGADGPGRASRRHARSAPRPRTAGRARAGAARRAPRPPRSRPAARPPAGR